MSILTISGSPSSRSRSTALLRYTARQLTRLGLNVRALGLRDVPADILINGEYGSPQAAALRERVDSAQAVVIATPIYKAAYSGGLKALLDLLDEKALANKVVLPIATGGSPAHLLALEYGLKPVLSALGARHILAGVYATDKHVRINEDGQAELDEEVAIRLDDAAEQLYCHIALPQTRRISTTDTSLDIGVI